MVVAVFDLYYLLVENVFGSVLFSGVALTILFMLLLFAGRVSAPTVIMLIAFFVGVFSIGYIGELGAFILFLFIGYYFVTSLIRFILRRVD